MNKENCNVCQLPLADKSHYDETGASVFKCIKCGRFAIEEKALITVPWDEIFPDQRTKISSWLRENPGAKITTSNNIRLLNLPMPTVAEKAEKLLQFLCAKYPNPGQLIKINFANNHYIFESLIKHEKEPESLNKEQKEYISLIAHSWAHNSQELKYILNDYLCINRKYLYCQGENYKITPEGWVKLDSIQNTNINSRLVFIAMKFDEQLKQFSESYIEPAIQNTGYTPKIVDKHEHNNLIDDEIIALIRQSRFMIADYTYNSCGVYYEAGFALGLGIEVIRLCESNFFKNPGLHFDQSHYPVLPWEFEKGKVLQKNLENKIIVLGLGNK
ncbi:hypothetical protein JW935_04930 [candidate division KSB1 bacterium]|nr:hypothetical protein [candidate division KSB1 bacterium]